MLWNREYIRIVNNTLRNIFRRSYWRVGPPKLHPNRSVTFTVWSPKASEIALILAGTRKAMECDSKGLWSYTTAPLASDMYAYSFLIDGISIAGLSSRIEVPFNPSHEISIRRTAGSLTAAWDAIPHGILHQHTFKSRLRNDCQEFFVYTPPDFQYCGTTFYPVLLLLHGFGDDASAWVNRGKCQVILDNLISQNRAKPMIVVMPSCYGIESLQFREKQWLQNSDLRSRNIRLFGEILKNEIKLVLRAYYPIFHDAEHSAIAGVSMGATQALYIAAETPSEYAWIGSFSAGGLPDRFEDALGLPLGQAGSSRKLLWITCGSEDAGITAHYAMCEYFSRMNIEFIAAQTAGRHDWATWRRNFEEFVQLIF